MPWKETCVEEQRMRFIGAWLDKECDWSVTELCEAFEVSRKSGYKWIERYETSGMAGLADRSRAPHVHPNATAEEVVKKLLAARKKHRYWGPRKLLVGLRREYPDLEWPAVSTAGELLKRHGMVEPRKRRRQRIEGAASELTVASEPNQVWAVDYKGWFRTGDGERCDPLTISDLFSRYLLECRRVKRVDTVQARARFEQVFREYGLPERIRSDNGTPFASNGLGGLSKLSVWWVKLGIGLERIAPARPDQNGCHERMHRTLRRETANPASANGPAQQRRFNSFRKVFNHERPHEALNDTPPAQWYRSSPRPYPSRLAETEYPKNYEVRRVRGTGEIKWEGRMIYLSEALIGELVGLEPSSDRHWTIHFGPVPLGIADAEHRKLLCFTRKGRGVRTWDAREARAMLESSGRPSGSLRSPTSREKDARK